MEGDQKNQRVMHRLAGRIAAGGIRGLATALLRNYIYTHERHYLFYRPFAQVAHGFNPEFECRLAREEDLDALEVFASTYPRSQFAAWLREGEFVFLAFHRGTPVAYQIVSRRSRRHKPFSSFPLERNQVWIVDVFTDPAFRRKHVAVQLREFRERTLREMGYAESVASVFETNSASLAYVAQGVSRRIIFVEFSRILFFTSLRVNPGAEAQLNARLAAVTMPGRLQRQRLEADILTA